jgi:hypothetical protein
LQRSDYPEPQLIAASIAAFDMNNIHRSQSGYPVLDSQVIPAIIMVGNAPVFYRTFVTTALTDGLYESTRPKKSTTVLRYNPPVPDFRRYISEGMRPLENRRVVFQCLEAFKAVIVRYSRSCGST